MSRFVGRAATAAACVAIVLLVVLLVILWTGVRFGTISGPSNHRDLLNETVTPQGRELYEESDRPPEIVTGASIAFDRPQHRFGVKPKTSAEAEDLNDKDGQQSVEGIEGYGQQFKNLTAAVHNVEMVVPKKIHWNIYEDPEESNTATRHHTGHFRHSTAEVWDPHPQYEFKAFGKDFHLLLSQDTSFISPDITVTHVGENTTRREQLGHQIGCFYSGTVQGDPKSIVSVSLCHGMSGHIRTSTGSYLIEPADRQTAGRGLTDKPVLHQIYLASATRSNSNSVNLPDDRTGENDCVLIDNIDDEAPALLIDDTSGPKIYVGEHPRRERRSIYRKSHAEESREDYYTDSDDFGRDDVSEFVRHGDQRQFLGQYQRPRNRYFPNERRINPLQKYQNYEIEDPFSSWRPRRALPQEYFIEIMVVADAKMAEYHGEGLQNYILILMSTVSLIYKDPSIGNAISIVVVKIKNTTETFGTKQVNNGGIPANEMLNTFCLWQKHNNNPDETSPEHYDAALLLTRENLCHNTQEQRCDTLGLAQLGKMCNPRSSCAIVQDNGLAAAFTIAHEIGHVLSMPHDDDKNCRKYRGNTRIHNVMSRMLDDNTFPWEWSNCSRHFVTDYLDSGYGNCLLDEPSATTIPRTQRLPGEDYSENKQCELVFGVGSKICPFMAVCRRLWCTAPVWDPAQSCHTQHMPWADGTACANGKWCHRGECVSRKHLKPVDGQWGPWGDYGECSRTCGGGIKKKYRECNNPLPQNGGNYCIGTRVKYRSCGTKDCPSDSKDFREEQCSKFNNNNMNIRNLARNVKWHAKYNRILPNDRCKLYCEVESNQYYMLRDKVIDGTPCGLDTFDICVNGRCKAAGCDHILNSSAELDTCGVCKGDNSTCQRITGSYNISRYGYTRVTKIPAGSSYIDIKQHGWRGSNNDSNYLALKNGETGENILNGKYMVAHRKVIIQPGITIEYSGPESVIERLNSSRPIAFDLILEILSVGSLYPPQISYEYTVPKNILTSYTWVLSDWTSCNRVCQGTMRRTPECRSTENKDVLPDDYCRAESKPSEENQPCNMHCTVRWIVISESECSSHCGPGTRTVISQCMYQFSAGTRPISEHACVHLARPASREVCIGPCDEAHWLYGQWGHCSKTCGGGIQFRTATCVDSNNYPVPESKCDSENKVLQQICEQGACPKWTLALDWTPCSVTCGNGTQEQPYWCQIENRVISTTYCTDPRPVSSRICDMGPCFKWHSSEWSPCSVSCGEGVLRREITCRNVNGTPSSECDTLHAPPRTRLCKHQPCPIQVISTTPITYAADSDDFNKQHENEIDQFHPGYTWRTGSFGNCSKPCNGGSQSRMVRCSSAISGEVSNDDYCDQKQKPPTVILCNQHACPRWNTGDWSQCASTCGPGFQHRQVRCQSDRGEILPDKECSESEKPYHVRRCFKEACTGAKTQGLHSSNIPGSVRWRVSKFTPCSKSCGYGTKTRRVDCVAKTGTAEVTVEDQKCAGLKRRPKSQRPCQQRPCALTWQEGPWTECSAECGNGMQMRTVTCHRVNKYEWMDPTPVNGCRMSERPATEQTCKLRECDDEYYWVAEPWRKCSATCGRKGKQVRRLFCKRKDGTRVKNRFCPRTLKPLRRRKCNIRRCGLLSCLEAKKKFKTTQDGEYLLIIGGKNMSIYCHNMTGDQPLEYLTLASGDHENFAEIYDKRLLDPRTCPFNGQRNDNCKCANYTGSTSGRTMFRRIRLDPRTLIVDVDDFTFSWTKGSKRVEFGKAGDCYSSAQCPQGQFSINLVGTQLGLSPTLSWVSQGSMTSRIINKINQQKVVGKCGGYCGFCKLQTGLKLDVLPP
ncbi:A disintegrin and metalloproteinase with thrombospondin motifs 9 isoform X1 [Neodiprion pinetum]|uniref:A disintegrin and metalloproteinase with thrombospondin motifs 9 isoform X1 n=2 Tax=Neodiprion pinetum TaxID=441929 RepID=UPI001EE00310|nr:A disintegrin and metalloproteinase with thrombospondin motifs 9-like isoform X1 [Neodiprion pinetum]